ncbi:hypothetical protein [Sphingomonas sp.]|uniref:hypothetical protein n=1 Tax=Sphingomonas sp. TaxID=28214 RepID=UPI002DD633DE|nr:hypothetical protein [Sphingomonas sp.]
MRFAIIAATACTLVLLSHPAHAQAMTLHSFLTKAKALEARGIFAMGSPDVALLSDEMTAVMRDYQADKTASEKAGRPFVCAPQGTKMSRAELMKAFEAIPPGERGMSVKAAFYRVARSRWPCPKS